MESNWIVACRELGLSAVLALVLAGILIFFVKWLVKHVNSLLDNAKQAQIMYQETIAKFLKDLEEHTQQAKAFHEEVKTNNTYVRNEHDRMIKNLDEQYKVLLRINGEKY